MLEGLASELRRYALLVTDVAYQKIRDRVAAKLLELALTHGGAEGESVRLQLTLSQGLLAGMVEATRENVNRALAELSDAGAVTITRGEYVVDPRRLRAFATEYALGHRRNRALRPP
jgi:CRP/FNR family cyclic AMP-dependent transcriptional regulator